MAHAQTEWSPEEIVDWCRVIPTDQSSHKNATKSIKANPSVISPTHAKGRKKAPRSYGGCDPLRCVIKKKKSSLISRSARHSVYNFVAFCGVGPPFPLQTDVVKECSNYPPNTHINTKNTLFYTAHCSELREFSVPALQSVVETNSKTLLVTLNSHINLVMGNRWIQTAPGWLCVYVCVWESVCQWVSVYIQFEYYIREYEYSTLFHTLLPEFYFRYC